MKIAVNTVRIIVGLLFIISGLVKANDPLGLGYKMQEFFEIWNTSLAASGFALKDFFIKLFSSLHAFSLELSIIMIALEIMAGIALLIGWKKNFVLNLLLLLIVFFTFLTAYAFFSGKFKNCGCFGDCLPITPLTSFIKDIVLLLMIIFLIIGRRYIQPFSTKAVRSSLLLAFLFLSIGVQWYALNYLPVADCLPFKKGNIIAEQMKLPKNAISDSFAIRFIYEKAGRQFEFSPEELPADLDTYKFVDRKDKLIRKGNAEPPIKGMTLTGVTGTDSTQQVLALPKTFLLFYLEIDNGAWVKEFKQIVENARGKNIPVAVVASLSVERVAKAFAQQGINVQVFSCDNVVVKQAARTNPTLYYLEDGKVIEKYGEKELDNANQKLK